jgi:hypothetical protein
LKDAFASAISGMFRRMRRWNKSPTKHENATSATKQRIRAHRGIYGGVTRFSDAATSDQPIA